jgi:hypothetical protein
LQAAAATGALRCLQKLVWEDNVVGDDAGAEALASTLPRLRSLRTLRLERSQMTDRGVFAVWGSLAGGAPEVFEQIYLGGNALSAPSLQRLAAAVTSRQLGANFVVLSVLRCFAEGDSGGELLEACSRLSPKVRLQV